MQAQDGAPGSSVEPAEIERFGRLADRWWDPDGPMRPLHQMNALRVAWIDSRIAPLRRRPGQHGVGQLQRLRLLDLGCGAGLASEALASLGHDVLGVDASEEAIDAARAHAQLHPLAGPLAYRVGSAETLLSEPARFDAIIALEVIEHVTDPARFLALLASLLRPGGIVILSTLNRSLRSLLVAKIGAEYVLRLLPAGTHDWRRFITPVELGRFAGGVGLRVADIAGMTPVLMSGPQGAWRESRDLSVNYIVALAG